MMVTYINREGIRQKKDIFHLFDKTLSDVYRFLAEVKKVSNPPPQISNGALPMSTREGWCKTPPPPPQGNDFIYYRIDFVINIYLWDIITMITDQLSQQY